MPRFFLPRFDADLGIAVNVSVEAARAAMRDHPSARVVTVTSPNYYGIAADMPGVAAAAREYDRLLVVDEAHGPHLHFHPGLPPSAVDAGADLTVQSTHKIVGGMTQASMLHLREGRVDGARVAAILQMLQSTSPSYILMASLDLARMQMATEGRKLLGKAIELAEEARARINRIAGVRCLGAGQVEAWGGFRLDVTKLTISVKGIGLTGYAASALLNTEFGIPVEMADLYTGLVLVSIGDRRDDLDRLVGGLEGLARRGSDRGARVADISAVPPVQETELACSPREAYFAPHTSVPLSRAAGRVSADIVTIYPPGIPILVPGEVVSRTAVEYLQVMGGRGARIDGVLDPTGGSRDAAQAGVPQPHIRVLVR